MLDKSLLLRGVMVMNEYLSSNVSYGDMIMLVLLHSTTEGVESMYLRLA